MSWGTCYAGSNNIHFNYPPIMADGRNYADWQPGAVVNERIKEQAGIKSNSQYRQYLTHNATQIMQANQVEAVACTTRATRFNRSPMCLMFSTACLTTASLSATKTVTWRITTCHANSCRHAWLRRSSLKTSFWCADTLIPTKLNQVQPNVRLFFCCFISSSVFTMLTLWESTRRTAINSSFVFHGPFAAFGFWSHFCCCAVDVVGLWIIHIFYFKK